MPPPRLPQAAAGLASAVSETVIRITQGQKTDVSYSDVSRGVTEGLRRGLTVIDFNFATKVCDEAHANTKFGEGHSDGFCRACAEVYVAVNAAIGTYRDTESDN
jgi:hypothetical protein